MIKIATTIYWCIDHGIGDLIFWPLLLTFCGFLIWLAGHVPACPLHVPMSQILSKTVKFLAIMYRHCHVPRSNHAKSPNVAIRPAF